MAKEGSTIGGLMDSFGTAISISLQYGVPLEVLVNKFSHTRFEPMGHTTNPDIRIAKSLVDYIFRWLGLTFLEGYREEHKAKVDLMATPKSGASSTPLVKVKSSLTSTPVNGNGAELAMQSNGYTNARFIGLGDTGEMTSDGSGQSGSKTESRGGQFAGFPSDAPSCDNCGSITVRSGNCYLCYNCGNSLGCS